MPPAPLEPMADPLNDRGMGGDANDLDYLQEHVNIRKIISWIEFHSAPFFCKDLCDQVPIL